jgi:hypothetical protein
MRKGTLGEKVEMKMAKAEVTAPAMQTTLSVTIGILPIYACAIVHKASVCQSEPPPPTFPKMNFFLHPFTPIFLLHVYFIFLIMYFSHPRPAGQRPRGIETFSY